MSIAINSNFERNQYVASFTGQVNFVYTFPIFSDTYLTVYQRGDTEVPDDPTQKLILGIDYTVSGVGQEAGGSITLTVGATAGDVITIVGTQPIERVTVFQDLNPFTVAMNQQLNTLTVLTQQIYTYWANLTPHYNFDELVSAPQGLDAGVRPFKLILPMLPDGHVWVGRGENGDIPDDITTALLPSGGASSDCCTATITQVAGGPVLALGNWVRINVEGTDTPVGAYVPALGADAHQGERVGMVVAILMNNRYTIQQSGRIADTSAYYGPFAVGVPLFLDTVTPGNMVPMDVSVQGQDSVPCFIPDTESSGWIVPYRGMIFNGIATGSGEGPTDTNIHTVSQGGNTFGKGDCVRVSAEDTYALADATTLANAQSVGIVISAGDPEFTIQFGGFNEGAVTGAVDGAGAPIAITAATLYYVSAVSPGKLTPDIPATGITRPIYISESVPKQSGFILPQRPLYEFGPDNASPMIFLGFLNTANSFTDINILKDSDGNTFSTYQLFVENGAVPNGGINGSGGGAATLGLQLYIGGSWITTGYNYFASGIFGAAGANVATAWAKTKNDGLAPSLVIYPDFSTDPSLANGLLTLNNYNGAHALTYNTYCQDVSGYPIVGYTSIGTAGCQVAGTATGLKVYFGGGASLATSSGYIAVYGIPNS